MEGKVIGIMQLLLMVALVMGQQPGTTTPITPSLPQTPPAAATLVPPAAANTPPLPPTPPAVDQQFPPPGAVISAPVMPMPGIGGGAGGVIPPLFPFPGGDAFGLIAPFIPGLGGFDLAKKMCIGRCALGCMRSGRNRFAAKMCSNLCMTRCGVRVSNNVAYGCTKHCANSLPLDSVSDDREAQMMLNSCYENCKSKINN